MANVPGYKYLGPGNKLNKGVPINEVDLIAQIHDIDYALAKCGKDIREADLEAIRQFHKIENPFDFGRILGKFGLIAKYGIESITGVLYGGGNMNKQRGKKRNLGQLLYGERQRQVHRKFNELKSTGKYKSLQEFYKSEEYKEIIKDYSTGGSAYKRIKTYILDDIPSGSKNPPTEEPTTDLPSTDPGSGSHDPRSSTPVDFEDRDDDFDWDNFLDNIGNSLNSADLADLPEASSMDISQAGSGRGPNTGARGEATAPSLGASSSGNGGNNSSPWLSRSVPKRVSNLEFKKSRIMYSYGLATERLENTEKTIDIFSTSMALIPVDFLPFYISQAEFANLPFASKIESVWCKVYPLGTRTAFDTGTTLSGTATSEYVPIGMTGIGLNLDFYGQNVELSGESTKPMIPTSIKQMSASKIVRKFYEDDACCAMGVPRSISEYFTIHRNKDANPDPEKYPQYQVNTHGVVNFDNKINKFLVNGLINQPVIDYKYDVKNGYVMNAKYHIIPHNRRSDVYCTHHTRGSKNKLEFYHLGDGPAKGQVGFKGKRGEVSPLNNMIANAYLRQLEIYGCFNIYTGTTPYYAQPQVHVGLCATPQLNPSNEDKIFLNSCCYWKVDCGITISTNSHSAMTKGEQISWPREVLFKETSDYKYTDGKTLFGSSVLPTGNITNMQDNIE
ncbi:uncharacterized protein LOC118740163 [Rhagoletis pomonella]|uniref:uncharacterized protein LOC118740163 n=1 Tax=Rhagoletis pomonella TaxID=28610 RepID=UPI0017836498|nr:uncharacterized protein LOC118740163 [Rhagoletis pomonella]